MQVTTCCTIYFNENTNRKQAVTKQGTRRYDVVFPKYKKGGYVVKSFSKCHIRMVGIYIALGGLPRVKR